MAIDLKTPDDIADEYLTHLKGLKPSVNTAQTDSDWYIRSKVVGGLISGVYADQRLLASDAFPQSARREALERHLETYFNEGFSEATAAVGNVKVTGTLGSVVPENTEFLYEPNSNVYLSTSAVTLSAASGVVPVQSVNKGQDQNLLEGAELTLSSPPAGIDSTAVVYGGNLSDGTNDESEDEAAARILARIRTPLAGGKVTDYQQWATDADPSVVSANVVRFPFGLGTVGVYITAGTSDIDTALDNGEPIVLNPSDALINKVQEYIETQNPVTDCVYVSGPNLLPVDVTVRVRLVVGDLSTIPSGQTLTQEELIQREVKRALYKTPIGGRKFGTSGFVVASEIEEVIDLALSSSPYTIGTQQLLSDRQVDDLSATGANLMILGNQQPVPGTITIIEIS